LLENTGEIVDDIRIPKPERYYSVLRHPRISLTVTVHLLQLTVLSAIELHDKTKLRTKEIENVRSGGMLPAKAYAANLLVSQLGPETSLHFGRVAPQFLRTPSFLWRAIETIRDLDPHPAPPAFAGVRRPPPSRGR